MKERYTFQPPRRVGTIFHLFIIAILTAGGGWGIWQTSNAEIAPQLIIYLSPIILFLILVPFLIYRLYALHRSQYTLDRDGVILQWGWRIETIPMDQIKWIHRAEDLNSPLKPPLLRWPGSIVGKRRLSQHSYVEFLAARLNQLIVIAGPKRYYVISPRRRKGFIDTYHHIAELGSLNPLPSQAARPTFLITQLWKQRPITIIISVGALLVLSLFIWAVIMIPQRQQISLGFSPQGIPHQPLPSVRLILLPILNTISYFGNLVVGLFLYRREENRILAYFLWGSSVIIGLVFHISMYYLIA